MTDTNTQAARPTRGVLAGLLVGVISTVFVTSYAAVIFTGPLSRTLEAGVGMGLFGAAVVALIGALRGSYPGAICLPQATPTLILALAARTLVERLQDAAPQTMFASVAMLIVLSGLLTGVAMVGVGIVRLGRLARFIPYPVMVGFLAATGWLIMLSGVSLAIRGDSLIAEPWRGAAPLALGLSLLVATRWSRSGYALPLGVVASIVFFFMGLRAFGLDLGSARNMGLLLGGAGHAPGLTDRFGFAILTLADYDAIAAQLPLMLALAGVASVAALLTGSSIEFATAAPVDLDRDSLWLGAANLLSAMGGGFPGYPAVAQTLLGRAIAHGSSRWTGVTVSAVIGAVLLGAAPLLANLPVAVFGGMLVYLGADMIYQWLWTSRRRLGPQDVAIVALILFAAVTVGLLAAIAVGVVAAMGLFVIAYARIDVVRAEATGAQMPSTTERPAPAMALLARHGAETLILSLQGYIFFASANQLAERIAKRIADGADAPRAVVLDFNMTEGVDVSAAFVLTRLAHRMRRDGVRLILTNLRPAADTALMRAEIAPYVERFATLDEALTRIEDDRLGNYPILVDEDDANAANTGADTGAMLMLLLAGADVAFSSPEPIAAGAVLFDEGDAADSLIVVTKGRLTACVAGPGGAPLRVARFLPGALVGEIAVYTGARRTATVMAEIDSSVVRLSLHAMERLSHRDPARAEKMHRMIAALLAQRLTRASARRRAVGD